MGLFEWAGSLTELSLLTGIAVIFKGAFSKKNKGVKSPIISNKLTSLDPARENNQLKLVLSSVLKEADLASCIWDTNTNETMWTENIHDICGIVLKNEVTLSCIRNIIIEKDRKHFDELIKSGLNGHVLPSVSCRVLTETNNIQKHVLIGLAIAQKDEKDIPSSIIINIQDLSKSQEKNVSHEVKNNYQLLTETLPIGIYKATLDGHLLYANQTMLNMFQSSSEKDFLSISITDLYADPLDREYFLHQLRNHSRLLDYKVELCKQDGSLFMAEINCLLHENEIHGIIQDSSSKTFNEIEKNKLIKTLESQNNDLEKFAHIISHHLRTPLANIMGLAQVIDTETLSEKNKEIYDLLNVSTNNLDLIIKDLNHIVSIRERKNSHFELVNVRNVFLDLVDEYNSQLVQKNIFFSSNIKETDHIHCIPGFVEGILDNIISNSIKFSDESKEKRFISLEFKKKTHTYNLKIRDNGIGFDSRVNSQKVFKLYERFNSTYPGRGVGLYTTYNQVNVLKGKIKIHSEEKIGTTVKIKLPRY